MITLSETDVRICEGCWTDPVTAARRTAGGRDLLCGPCAISGVPPRVTLFPPFGIYKLTGGRPDQGPPLPTPRPAPSPPGTPPV